MNQEPSSFEEFISPDLPDEFSAEEFSLVDDAADIAKGQTEMRDLLSLTIGNLFAFFAILFPPIIAKVIDRQTDRADQSEQNSPPQK
jgi:hypothetical protein